MQEKTMTTDLAAALLRDIQRWRPEHPGVMVPDPIGVWVDHRHVLAALSAHLAANLADRAGEVIESLRLWNRDDAADLITALLAQNAALRAERDSLLTTWAESRERHLAAEAEVEKLRGALDRIGKAWPIVRDADCSGGTLVWAIDEIDAALTTEEHHDR